VERERRESASTEDRSATPAAPNMQPSRETPGIKRERYLLRFMLHSAEWCDRVVQVRPPEEFGTDALRELASEIHDMWSRENGLNARDLVTHMQDADASALLSDLLLQEGPEITDSQLHETLYHVRLSDMEEERRRAQQDLVQAEAAGDRERVDALCSLIHDLNRDIEEFKAHNPAGRAGSAA
jgi:hypothetical protein